MVASKYQSKEENIVNTANKIYSNYNKNINNNKFKLDDRILETKNGSLNNAQIMNEN
jgi:hypothetical protein